MNLGNLAQVALSNVEMALKTNDHNLAQETIDADKKINELELKLEEMTFNIFS